MSFFASVTSEIKKTAATKIAGAVVGTATLAAGGATLSYFANSSSAPATAPTQQAAAPASALGMQAPPSAPVAAPPMPKMPDMSGAASGMKPQTAATAGGVTVEYQADYGTAAASDGKDARDQAQEFLNSKGWVEGRNPNGMIVVVGKASLPCGSDSDKFDECRRQAYLEAMFGAKKELVKYLSLEVSASMSSMYSEGDILKQMAQTRSQNVSQQPGLVQKVALLCNSYIEEELKERGVDFGQAQTAQADAERQRAIEMARKEAEQLQSSAEFKSAVEACAMAEVSAIQAYRTFEYIAPGAKGSIAVVAIYSEKSGQFQQAFLGRGDAPSGAPKEAISKWAQSQGAGSLLYTFGPQPRVNENGELVLVAFGQSTPIGSSERQLDAAESKARINAERDAREFFGGMVQSQEQQIEASTLKDFADSTSAFQSQSSYQAAIASRAERLSMPGGLPAFRWKMKHPLSDKTTVGVVMVFSVSEALAANKLRDAFKAAGGAAGGAGISTKRPAETAAPKPPQQGRPLTGGSGTGAEGDEP
jgi:hypothetical protein